MCHFACLFRKYTKGTRNVICLGGFYSVDVGISTITEMKNGNFSLSLLFVHSIFKAPVSTKYKGQMGVKLHSHEVGKACSQFMIHCTNTITESSIKQDSFLCYLIL